MKKEILIIAAIFLMINSASALIAVRNSSIALSYGPGESLRGWINMSLEEQNASALLTAFNSEISLLDFLGNNSLVLGKDYTCFPSDCKTSYKDSGRELNKTYSLNPGDKKVLGIKITGDIQSVDSFSMKIQSTAGESGYPQLFVDILNDWEIEWQPHSFSGAYGNPIYGCYENGMDAAEITQSEYCEKIELPPAPKIKIGADVQEVPGKGGKVNFKMRIYSDDNEGSCTASASGSGKIECEVNMQVKETGEFFVCIKTDNYADNNKYSMLYEQNQPCGFSDYGNYEYDFPIFARTGRYPALGEVTLNQDEINKYSETGLADYIESYLDERYNGECEEGCIIPLRLISGDIQTLNISDVQLSYTSGISKTERHLNNLQEEPAKLDIGFKALELEKSGIKVPTSHGKWMLVLKLGDEEILQKTIDVLKLATIESLFPLQAAAAVPVKFHVYATGNISGYKWDFGDGTAVVSTKENFTSHTYSATGSYKLKVSAVNPQGEAIREFDIPVRSPEEEINRTLTEKRASLNNLTARINGISGWYKPEIEKQVNISSLKAELDAIQERYETSEDYIEIMKDLLEIDIPAGIESVSFKGEFLPFPEKIDPDYVSDKGTASQEDSERIVIWMAENIDLELESNIISLKNQGANEPLFTAITLNIVPQADFREAFLIIQGEDIKFKEDYGQEELNGAMKMDLSDIKEKETISFILPGKIEAIDLPVYISPKISSLQKTDVGPCNNNGKCEKEEEEDKENCPNDCHGINWPGILAFIIFLFCVFVVYIILQEWYKKHYEGHLFKNKGDLYNLMSFIFNALRQGKDKGEISKTLRQYKWKNEQITYAYNKLLGKRTGMWEIPIFRSFEKNKVKEELAKRGQIYSPKMVQ